MKLINRDTDYAIKALCFMAKNQKEVVSVSLLVEKLKIPRPFLRKILQALNKDGLLKSVKGKGGGFQLAKPPKWIFLTDLLRVFHGPFKLNQCRFKKDICPDIKTCALRKKVDSIEKYVKAELSLINVASLINKEG